MRDTGKTEVVGQIARCSAVQALVNQCRDATYKEDYAVERCLSVRLSVTRQYSVETAKRIIKLFTVG